MLHPRLEVGVTLHGYCNGYFGRFYLNKTVEAFGRDWIVARESDGTVLLATFDTATPTSAIEELIESWL